MSSNRLCVCGHRESCHSHCEVPYGTLDCLGFICECRGFTPAPVTAKGTVLHRSRLTGVGKLVGSHLYLHADYALEATSRIKALKHELGVKLEKVLALWIQEFPAFQFRCLRLDLKTGAIRFDEAPDFDSAREPMVGKWLNLTPEWRVKRDFSSQIWHHKWLWVKPSYQNFDVSQSQAWSAKYCPLIAGAPCGDVKRFAKQLHDVGLP